MGLFDSWRRKKKPQKKPTKTSPKKIQSVEGNQDNGDALLAEHHLLIQRRAKLQKEREELTAKLDRGEIDPNAFRTELMDRIQEAATVSEKIRATAAKLTSLGYRGVGA